MAALENHAPWHGEETGEKVSFRTAGAAPSGKRAAGHPAKQRSESQPTIPSRYETTIYRGVREVKGFGSHSLRFDKDSIVDVPGPGNYSSQKSFHQDSSDSTSWGIRGTGGFASRSRRFGSRSMPQMPAPGRGAPGPGAYAPLKGLHAVRDPKDFNKAKQTGNFAPGFIPGFADRASGDPVPGPGTYTKVQKPPTQTDPNGALCAFRSTSQRTSGAPIIETGAPGPGQYKSVGTRTAPLVPTFDKFAEVITANFQDPVPRQWAKVHQDLPLADEMARKALGDFATAVAKECRGQAADNPPGPGHYKQDRDGMWEGRVVGSSGWSSFQPGGKRTDWAPDECRRKPGPGRYDPNPVSKETMTSAASVFTSGTDRLSVAAPAVPGPAFYSPSLPKNTKSFHLNAKRSWL